MHWFANAVLYVINGNYFTAHAHFCPMTEKRKRKFRFLILFVARNLVKRNNKAFFVFFLFYRKIAEISEPETLSLATAYAYLSLLISRFIVAKACQCVRPKANATQLDCERNDDDDTMKSINRTVN